jgi:PAS domain S-box-containing protein
MATLSRQTSAVLSQVVEQIADGVLLTDPQGFIEYVNPAFESMTGFSADDVRGKTPRILKSGLQEASFYEELWGELRAGRSFQATINNRRKSGKSIQLRRPSPLSLTKAATLPTSWP